SPAEPPLAFPPVPLFPPEPLPPEPFPPELGAPPKSPSLPTTTEQAALISEPRERSETRARAGFKRSMASSDQVLSVRRSGSRIQRRRLRAKICLLSVKQDLCQG